jgi:hydrogenase 3 maturation protease
MIVMTRPWPAAVRRELRGARRVAVLGIGNPDRGDDGAGPASVRVLRKALPGRSSSARLIEAGPMPENFTGPLRRFAPSHVILVDAVRAGRKPGAVFLVDPASIGHDNVSSHRAPLSWLVRYLAETTGCRVLLLGVQPGRTEPSEALSAVVRKSVERVAAGLARILAAVPPPAQEKRTTTKAGKRPRPVRSSSA